MGNRPINRRPWRRAPWRKRLKPGEKGWINGVSTNCGFADVSGSYLCDPEDPDSEAGRNRIEIISGAELAEHEDNLKMIRLVGDCVIVPNAGEPEFVTMRSEGTYLRMGLLVVDADMSSGTEVIPWVSPVDMVNNADRSWLWLRTEWIDPHNGANTEDVRDYTATRFDVDVRVQRRLKADQRLVMMITAINTGILPTDVGNAFPVGIALNLRAFISF